MLPLISFDEISFKPEMSLISNIISILFICQFGHCLEKEFRDPKGSIEFISKIKSFFHQTNHPSFYV